VYTFILVSYLEELPFSIHLYWSKVSCQPLLRFSPAVLRVCVNGLSRMGDGWYAVFGGIKFAHWPRGADVDGGCTFAVEEC